MHRTRQPAAKKPCRRFPIPRGAAAEIPYNRNAVAAACSAPVSAKSVGRQEIGEIHNISE